MQIIYHSNENPKPLLLFPQATEKTLKCNQKQKQIKTRTNENK